MRFSILAIVACARAATGALPSFSESDDDTFPLLDDDMDMRRDKADVSFRVSTGDDSVFDMTVLHNGDTIECIELTDDVNDVTEVRAADGASFVTLRGGGGYLLESSQSAIECRVHIRSASGAPYTVADLHHPPGFFSAYIVLSSGHYLEIERDNATNAYVSLSPKQLEPTSRRRLQAYKDFRCKLPQKKYLKMGIILDQEYLSRRAGGDRDTAVRQIRELWKEVSIPYIQQFNIAISASRILFHDDPTLNRQNWVTCGDSTQGGNNRLGAWRNSEVPDKFAAWILAIGCSRQQQTQGYAFIGTLAGKFSGRGRASTAVSLANKRVMTHEIGHLFGGLHTFERVHNLGEGFNGVMSYGKATSNADFLFHPTHENEMCRVVDAVSGKTRAGFTLVADNERWGSDPSSTTPPPTPPTTTPMAPTPSPKPPTPPKPPTTPTATTTAPAPSPKPPTSPSPPSDSDEDTDSALSTEVMIIVAVGIIALILCFAYSRGGTSESSFHPAAQPHALGRRTREIKRAKAGRVTTRGVGNKGKPVVKSRGRVENDAKKSVKNPRARARLKELLEKHQKKQVKGKEHYRE
eukprot:GEMP01008181.1.p1 GENE.GEMP01008181.1~~GEMP01008181.1.p1  ORF type:complete len:579 (+),score=122.11 GEMP01008181.1:74-1810(+)